MISSHSGNVQSVSKYLRPVQRFNIVRRYRASAFSVSSLEDFTICPNIDLADSGIIRHSLPYCLNLDGERVIYTLVDDLSRIVSAPFLYQAQFSNASDLIAVPFERLSEFEGNNGCNPTFCFSIGRCGSTLLSALVRAAGIAALSEPDVYTQLAALNPTERATLGCEGLRLLLQALTCSLANRTNSNVFIKLRSQCNGIATDFAAAWPTAQIVFVLREPIEWARSRYLAFGDDPRSLAGMYKWGVETYDRLLSAGAKVNLIWYEEMRDKPTSIMHKLGLSPTIINQLSKSHFDAVLAHDSQEGTPIERSRPSRSPMSASEIAAFVDIWQQTAPKSTIERLGLQQLFVR